LEVNSYKCNKRHQGYLIILPSFNLILLHLYAWNRIKMGTCTFLYILPCFCPIKNFWCSKILKQFWNILWIFKVLKFHILKNINVFLMWLICFYHLYFFNETYFIIWILFIVLCKIDSIWCNRCTFSNILN
jgi:hypothetical protein